MNEDQIREVLAQYGFRAQKMRPIRNVVMAETEVGNLFVKRSRLRSEEIAFCHAAQEHIFQQGFTRGLRFLVNRNEIPYTRIQDQLYVVSPWVPSKELHYDHLADLLQAGRFLAEFHLSTKGFAPPLGSLRVEWGVWPRKFRRRLEDLKRCKLYLNQRGPLTQFDRIFLTHVDDYCEWGEKTLSLLERQEYYQAVDSDQLKQCFCHHDYSDRNILRIPTGDLYLVDFDYCLCDVCMHDLASLVIRALKGGNWGLKLALQIIKAYEEIRPLESYEPAVLQILFQWPEGFWRIASQYYDERLPWSQERFVKTMQRRVRYKHRTERFLKQFAGHFGITT